VALTLAATPAYAQSQGMLDNVLNKYKSMAAAWASVFTTHATILFGTLAAISLIWTFGQMALRRADLGEFASEAIRFAIFCGFFWWLLINGPAIGIAIIEGLRSLGAQASGLPNNLAPSGIVDIGFDIFRQAVEASSVLTPVDSALSILVSLGILIVLALVGVNMLLLLASGYILAYGGVIFWASAVRVGPRHCAELFQNGGRGRRVPDDDGSYRRRRKTFLDQYYAQRARVRLSKIWDHACLRGRPSGARKQGSRDGRGVISGGSIHAAGGIGAFGAGAALGAAGMAAGAAATGGAMIAAGAMNAAGGASAIKAAFAAAGGSGGEGGQTGMEAGNRFRRRATCREAAITAAAVAVGAAARLSVAMGGDGGSPRPMTTAAFKAARKPPARAAARLQAPLRVARRPIVKTATAAALPVARLRGGGGQLRQLAR
jgi:type IV secretion system protein TrbL